MNNNFRARLVKKFYNYDIVQDPGHKQKRKFLTRIIQLPFPPSVGMRITSEFTADSVEWDEDSQSFCCEENEISSELPEATFDWTLTEYAKWKEQNPWKKEEEGPEFLYVKFIIKKKNYPHHSICSWIQFPSEEDKGNLFQYLCSQPNKMITLYDKNKNTIGLVNSSDVVKLREYKLPKIEWATDYL